MSRIEIHDGNYMLVDMDPALKRKNDWVEVSDSLISSDLELDEFYTKADPSLLKGIKAVVVRNMNMACRLSLHNLPNLTKVELYDFKSVDGKEYGLPQETIPAGFKAKNISEEPLPKVKMFSFTSHDNGNKKKHFHYDRSVYELFPNLKTIKFEGAVARGEENIAKFKGFLNNVFAPVYSPRKKRYLPNTESVIERN